MTLDIDAAFGIHAQALALRARRAEILAANLANADTPAYQARDFDFRAALNHAQGAGPADVIRVAATHPGHLHGDGEALAVDLLYRVPAQPTLDGNTVDTQVEQAELARNAMSYMTSLTLLNGRIRSLRTAIRGD